MRLQSTPNWKNVVAQKCKPFTMQPNGILGNRRNCFFILRHCAHDHKTAFLIKSSTISSINKWQGVSLPLPTSQNSIVSHRFLLYPKQVFS